MSVAIGAAALVMLPFSTGVASAAVFDPGLGTQWSVSDTGGAPQPWIGNWTQQSDGTWNWFETNTALPGSPTVRGTATMSFDGATVQIHRLTNNSPQICDYVGTVTGYQNSQAEGFSGTVNCTNSGIRDMEWWTNSIQ
ncbi:hypothetical protein [Nocardia sp. NPDC059239]